MVIVTVFLSGQALNACQSTGTPAVARPLAQAFPNSLQRIQSSPRKKEQGVRSRYFVSFLLEYRSTLLQKASYTLVQCVQQAREIGRVGSCLKSWKCSSWQLAQSGAGSDCLKRNSQRHVRRNSMTMS